MPSCVNQYRLFLKRCESFCSVTAVYHSSCSEGQYPTRSNNSSVWNVLTRPTAAWRILCSLNSDISSLVCCFWGAGYSDHYLSKYHDLPCHLFFSEPPLATVRSIHLYSSLCIAFPVLTLCASVCFILCISTASFCKDQSALKSTVFNSYTIFQLLGFCIRPPNLSTTDTMMEVPFKP